MSTLLDRTFRCHYTDLHDMDSRALCAATRTGGAAVIHPFLVGLPRKDIISPRTCRGSGRTRTSCKTSLPGVSWNRYLSRFLSAVLENVEYTPRSKIWSSFHFLNLSEPRQLRGPRPSAVAQKKRRSLSGVLPAFGDHQQNVVQSEVSEVARRRKFKNVSGCGTDATGSKKRRSGTCGTGGD